MNFNQLSAAAAAAAAGDQNLNLSSFTNAVSTLLANSNINLNLSHLTGLGQLGQQLGAAAAANSSQSGAGSQASSASGGGGRHRSSTGASSQAVGDSSQSTGASSMANLQSADVQANLAATLSNLANSSLAELTAHQAAAAAAAAAHLGSSTRSSTGSLQSAHHQRNHNSNNNNNSNSSSNNNNNNSSSTASSNNINSSSSSTNNIAAAHQASQGAKHQLAAAHHHHNQATSLSHHNYNHHHHHHHPQQQQRAHSAYSAPSIHHHHSSNSASNHQQQQHTNSHHHSHHRHNSHTSLSHHNSSSATALLNHHSSHSSSSTNNHHHHHNSSSSNNNSLINHHHHNQNQQNNPTQTIIATNNSSNITPPKCSTCYRIGDCIYFEQPQQQQQQPQSPTLPLQIGRIDEICKTSTTSSNNNANNNNNGDNNIELKVVLFFRRRDISSSLMSLADKYQYDESQEEEIKAMSEKDQALLKQRELFYSRQIETIPASFIKGKCTVQLLNESESLASYLSKDDHYFYTLVYDPQQKTISADRGEIRVGQRYQAEVQPAPSYTTQSQGGDPNDTRDLKDLETLVYTPDHNLTDDDINKFLTIAKSVGTFARALDCSSSIKQPSLHLTAASASRDVTLLYAMHLLHQNNYDLGRAVCALVPSTGPVLCRDEIEEWTAGEATLFEEAIEKYGREFGDIRQDFLPWKSVKNIVEYYYMWKTTDRSINQRRMKALEAENKVSVIYVTNPESEVKKSSNLNTNTSVNIITSNSNNNNNNNIVSTASGPDANHGGAESGKARSLKRPQESDESSINSSMENTNATLKRRQVTEPKLSAHVACHTTPGENLRFISTKRHKILRRGLINRKQLRHLSRRPWERRAKSRT